MPMTAPAGDLARVKSSEPSESWPDVIEIVAYFGYGKGRRGKRKSIRISADEFFGHGAHGAPMSGDQLIAAIERLRRS